MRTVANYWNVDEAYMAASVLEGSGLSPNVRDAHAASLYVPQSIGGVTVEVPEEEYLQAMEILELTVRDKERLACPYCGSEDVRFAQVNWRSLAMSLLTFAPLAKQSERVRCNSCRQFFRIPTSVDS